MAAANGGPPPGWPRRRSDGAHPARRIRPIHRVLIVRGRHVHGTSRVRAETRSGSPAGRCLGCRAAVHHGDRSAGQTSSHPAQQAISFCRRAGAGRRADSTTLHGFLQQLPPAAMHAIHLFQGQFLHRHEKSLFQDQHGLVCDAPSPTARYPTGMQPVCAALRLSPARAKRDGLSGARRATRLAVPSRNGTSGWHLRIDQSG